jgi:hypothetical protein
VKRDTLRSFVLAATASLGIVAFLPVSAAAQPSGATAISPRERVDWVVDGTIGRQSLLVGVIASTWDTGWKIPEEWPRDASGFSKRYLQREADVAISSTIEAGVGSLWGEDPRYHRSPTRGAWARTRYAMKTVLLAPRADGELGIAWGRISGNVFNNVIENAWLPPSVTTPGQTALRSAQGFVGRLIGNLWEEFQPEIRRHVLHRRGRPASGGAPGDGRARTPDGPQAPSAGNERPPQ